MIEVIGAREVALAFDTAGVESLAACKEVTKGAATSLMDAWKAGARASSGKHGKWYPSAITMETVPTFGGAGYEIGPETGKKQGGMGRGFEYGSRNQPPHLDMKRAADGIEPKFAAAVELAAVGML